MSFKNSKNLFTIIEATLGRLKDDHIYQEQGNYLENLYQNYIEWYCKTSVLEFKESNNFLHRAIVEFYAYLLQYIIGSNYDFLWRRWNNKAIFTSAMSLER